MSGCEICGEQTNYLLLLPIKQSDGKLDTQACKKCASLSSVYCQIHQEIHLGFPDNTSACPKCIEGLVSKQGKLIGNKLLRLVDTRDNNWENFIDWVRDVQMFAKDTAAVAASRAVISYALRHRLSPERVIEMVEEQGPQLILPPIVI